MIAGLLTVFCLVIVAVLASDLVRAVVADIANWLKMFTR